MPGYVWRQWQLEAGKSIGSIALIDTEEMDGKPIEQFVRDVKLEGAPLGTVSFEYHCGLVRVGAGNNLLLFGHSRSIMWREAQFAHCAHTNASGLRSSLARHFCCGRNRQWIFR